MRLAAGSGVAAAVPALVRVVKPGLDPVSDGEQKLFVVGFDPGGKTGWCVMRMSLAVLLRGGLSGVSLSHPSPEVFSMAAGYFDGPEPYQAELMMALLRGVWMHGGGVWDEGRESDLFIVSVESFTLLMSTTDPDLLSPVRITAQFKALGWRSLFVPVIAHSPSDAKKTIDDHRLKMLNLWTGVPGDDGSHQRDATRQAAMVARKAVDPAWLREMVARMPWVNS